MTEEILALAETDPAFLDIVARPSLLFLVANQRDTKEFIEARRARIDSATVIGLFILNTLRRQTEKSRHHHHFMVLNESERAYFMDGIATYMAHHQLPNQIPLVSDRRGSRAALQADPGSGLEIPRRPPLLFRAPAQIAAPGPGRCPGAG